MFTLKPPNADVLKRPSEMVKPQKAIWLRSSTVKPNVPEQQVTSLSTSPQSVNQVHNYQDQIMFRWLPTLVKERPTRLQTTPPQHLNKLQK